MATKSKYFAQLKLIFESNYTEFLWIYHKTYTVKLDPYMNAAFRSA